MEISFISSVSVLLPLITGLVIVRTKDRFLRFFVFYLCLSAFTEAALMYTAYHHQRNHWIVNLFTLVESLFFIYFYRSVLKSYWAQMLCLVLTLLISGTFSWICVAGETYMLNSQFSALAMLNLIILSGTYLVVFFDDFDIRPTREPLFWISVGVMLYAVLSISIFTASSLLLEQGKNSYAEKVFTIIHAIANIVANSIYTLALLCKRMFRK